MISSSYTEVPGFIYTWKCQSCNIEYNEKLLNILYQVGFLVPFTSLDVNGDSHRYGWYLHIH